MPDLLRRPYEPADAPALAELMNVIEEHGGGHPSHTAEELRGLITALVRDLASDSTMVFAGDGALMAAGFTTTPPPNGFRVYLTGGVHPRWRGHGLGRELLGRQLTRADEIHRVQAPGAAWVAEIPRTPLADEAAIRLYRRFGMTAARYWFEMVASTAQVPAAPTPDGLRLVAYSPKLDDAVYDAHMEAFAANWAFQHRDRSSWLGITVRSGEFLPELSLVALDGSELAGYVLTYDAEPERVYVGQLGVRRQWRRRGLAVTLLARVLDAAAAAGRKQVGLSVDADSPTGAVGVYERAGFTAEFTSVTHSIPLGSIPLGSIPLGD